MSADARQVLVAYGTKPWVGSRMRHRSRSRSRMRKQNQNQAESESEAGSEPESRVRIRMQTLHRSLVSNPFTSVQRKHYKHKHPGKTHNSLSGFELKKHTHTSQKYLRHNVRTEQKGRNQPDRSRPRRAWCARVARPTALRRSRADRGETCARAEPAMGREAEREAERERERERFGESLRERENR